MTRSRHLSSVPKRAAAPPRGVPPGSASSSGGVPSADDLAAAYHDMVRARAVDEKSVVLYKQSKAVFQIGCAGHEAIQVAAARALRPGVDWCYPYYRDLAFCAALGMTDFEFMANCMNRECDPNSHGRQMPMHWGHRGLRIVSQSSPTGTQFLQAVGAALSARLAGRDEVAYVSAGDGTCAQGDFHEALNWAARERLGVVFLIQNNGYAISVPFREQIAARSVASLVQGYEGLAAYETDGTDYEESFRAMTTAVRRARSGEGPALVEAHVPRLGSHSISDNQAKYRPAEETESDKKRCPIVRLRALLTGAHGRDADALSRRDAEIRRKVDEAAEEAERAAPCDPSTATAHVVSSRASVHGGDRAEELPPPPGPDVYLVDALGKALDEELARDPRVVVFGQDVARGKGGVFSVTAGLTDRHGARRVFNTQLAESAIAGVAIGLATAGHRPVAEIQFGDYVWTAMMQIRNELAMMRYRSGGDFTCPAVFRIPVGGYIHGGAYHSQNIEATFSHFPGLLVAYPSNSWDAKGLLKTAVRGDDPVLFLEHKGLYRQPHAATPVGGPDALLPFGRARVAREGRDLTIVTYGALVQKCLAAAKRLADEGFSAEVIDLRTIVPLDTATIEESVAKTSRLLVAHEDVAFMGFGAEVAAHVADACFRHLDAPVRRVGMKNVAAVPHSPPLEEVVLPQTATIEAAARALLAY